MASGMGLRAGGGQGGARQGAGRGSTTPASCSTWWWMGVGVGGGKRGGVEMWVATCGTAATAKRGAVAWKRVLAQVRCNSIQS